MSKKITSDMVSKNKHKNLLSCSTPEHNPDSPSRDSDSLCDSDAASPVPFLCTQDGAEGETDVVWNFYTPKSERPKPEQKDTTPLSRKSKRSLRPKLIEKHLPKRRAIKTIQKNTQLFQDLIELNQNLHELISKKPHNVEEKPVSGSDDDIFSESPEYSPKARRRLSSNCLRRNVLNSHVNKQDSENAIESDDSMNECLFKASQFVEDNLLSKDVQLKIPHKTNVNIIITHTSNKLQTNQESVNYAMNKIKLATPKISELKNDSICFNNDSFDTLVGNLNDSALEQLSQMPIKVSDMKTSKDCLVKNMVCNSSPLSKSFGRHSSMPESPLFSDINKPSSSGMVFGRYSSMPQGKNKESKTGDSPIKCSAEEIRKKHQQAKEKLLAKRLLPFTQQTQSIAHPQQSQYNFNKVQNKPPTFVNDSKTKAKFEVKTSKNFTNLKELLEQKRQEALMKLRRRQQQK